MNKFVLLTAVAGGLVVLTSAGVVQADHRCCDSGLSLRCNSSVSFAPTYGGTRYYSVPRTYGYSPYYGYSRMYNDYYGNSFFGSRYYGSFSRPYSYYNYYRPGLSISIGSGYHSGFGGYGYSFGGLRHHHHHGHHRH